MGLWVNQLCTLWPWGSSRVATGAYLDDPTQALLKLGLSIVLLIFVSVSAVTTNLLNIYSATVSTPNVFPKVKYAALVTLYGGLTTALAIVPVLMTNFEYFLTYIGVVFVPLTTTLIMHYLVPGGEKGMTEGLVSWIIGAVVGLIISTIYGYGATISSLVTSAASLTLYIRNSILRYAKLTPTNRENTVVGITWNCAKAPNGLVGIHERTVCRKLTGLGGL